MRRRIVRAKRLVRPHTTLAGTTLEKLHWKPRKRCGFGIKSLFCDSCFFFSSCHGSCWHTCAWAQQVPSTNLLQATAGVRLQLLHYALNRGASSSRSRWLALFVTTVSYQLAAITRSPLRCQQSCRCNCLASRNRTKSLVIVIVIVAAVAAVNVKPICATSCHPQVAVSFATASARNRLQAADRSVLFTILTFQLSPTMLY